MEKKLYQHKLYGIIFESESSAGKFFDICLLWMIILSVLVVILESVSSIRENWGHVFNILEWFFTVVFTLEFICRIFCVKKPQKYIFSFMGMIDLLAILPSYLGLFFTSHSSFLIF